MELSNQALAEFKELYQRKTGVLLEDSQANSLGIYLLDLMRQVYKPIAVNQNIKDQNGTPITQ